jgi:hypothetical protein
MLPRAVAVTSDASSDWRIDLLDIHQAEEHDVA